MTSASSSTETEMQKEIRSLMHKFASSELAPLSEKDELDGTFRPEMIARMGELGLTGLPIEDTWGGAGLGYVEYTTALQELAKISVTYSISVAVTGLAQIILQTFGSEAQKKKFIPPLASGQAIGAFSLSEAGSGSDAGALRTRAEKKGDHYLLNGSKLWCTQGDVAKTLIVFARTGEEGPKGISAFVVEKGMKGFKTGKREEKMALHGSHTMELVLENVKVPLDHLIGQEGQGFKIALSALDSGRITIASSACGIAHAALEIALSHAQERKQFGQPIADFQGISFMLADMATQLDASWLLVQRAAQLRDTGKPYSPEAAMAKCFATDAAMKITTDAVQILGGSGYTREFPLERYMREAKVMQIVEGTNQIQRLVIARNLKLKGYSL